MSLAAIGNSLMNGQRTERDIRVGIAGAGIIAGIHLPNLRQLGGVHIAAICDVDEDRAIFILV